jgi:hypothetical protein
MIKVFDRKAYMKEYMKKWLSNPENRKLFNEQQRKYRKANYVPKPRVKPLKCGKLIRCVFCGATLVEDNGKFVERAVNHYVHYTHGWGCINLNADLEWGKFGSDGK